MMSRNRKARFLSLLAIIFLSCIIASCAGKGDTNDPSDNPIDRAFSEDIKNASATVEIRYVAHMYLTAWEAEWNYLFEDLSEHYQFEEDKKLLKEYKERYEAFVEKGSMLEWTDWSDTSVAPGKARPYGTGTIGASLMEEAALYRNQVLYLIDKYYSDSDMYEYGEYTYLYSGNGAEFDKAL
ncbi:hypothetical protein M2105_002522 [Paenibacillus sp. PastF-1]|nr:hypothetical protein [Paenibacillus sp. PastF-2]MDF9848096.1 hypothetical protein [Paenibacillus sp. PastM-2]MDF9854665.1 hypothetical protein [Paenibacillus sp. PastF-1]MDH6479727.1 hypothetical protein [Paenibacillus sp. PastH-2]MDH6507371.1 hypothetical protein [Paenibacillus sp. PastM-3]